MLNADFALAAAVPVLQLALLAILIHRRLYRRFLFFSIYSLYSITAATVRLWAMHRPYFAVVYWSTEIVYGC